MPNPAIAKAQAKLAAKGTPAVITWPVKGLLGSGTPETLNVYVALMGVEATPDKFISKVLLGATTRSIKGASLAMLGRTYTVVDAVSYYDGDEMIVQEALLA